MRPPSIMIYSCHPLTTPLLYFFCALPPLVEGSLQRDYLPLLATVDQVERFFLDEFTAPNLHPKQQKNQLNKSLSPKEMKRAKVKAKQLQERAERLKHTQQKRVTYCEKIRESLLDLLYGKISIDTYLYRLLRTRLLYLQHRTATILAYKQREPSIFVPPCAQALFDDFSSDPFYKENPSFLLVNQQVRSSSLLLYDFLNMAILEAFSKVRTLSELKKDTLEHLYASVQLQKILQTNRIDNHHADQTGGYGLLMPFLKKLREKQQLYDKLFSNQTGISVKAAPPLEIYRIAVEHYIDQETYHHDELFKSHLGFDVCHFNAHFVRIPSVVVPIPKLKKSSSIQDTEMWITAYELGDWPYKLDHDGQFKRWLHHKIGPPDQLRLEAIGPIFSQHHPYTPAPPTRPTTLGSRHKKLKKEHQQSKRLACHLNPKQAQKLPEEKRTTQGLAKSGSSNKMAHKITRPTPLAQPPNTTEKMELPHTKQLIKRKKKEVRKSSNTPPSNGSVPHHGLLYLQDYPPFKLPFGLLNFEKRFREEHAKPIALPTKWQRLVNNLFHPKKFTRVCLRELIGLAERLGAKIESKRSGSHRQLYAPNGRRLWGIWGKNKNQRYGKHYIAYIRAWVLFCGGRPQKD